ncbi:hypothetical protein WJX74_006921 [Apatococcus lobatus]|uniref:Uncharacterized protein n=1 Tax=Apatococcus lobatus TaxID=904363 RepID=A0AAW1QDU6_9CHLO
MPHFITLTIQADRVLRGEIGTAEPDEGSESDGSNEEAEAGSDMEQEEATDEQQPSKPLNSDPKKVVCKRPDNVHIMTTSTNRYKSLKKQIDRIDFRRGDYRFEVIQTASWRDVPDEPSTGKPSKSKRKRSKHA